jgi:trans-aconitate methyltransferase
MSEARPAGSEAPPAGSEAPPAGSEAPPAELPSPIDWRLLQAEVWAPAGRRLLANLDHDVGAAVDVGCGPLGWLPLLVERFPAARVVGVDDDAHTLVHTRHELIDRGMTDVELRLEDLFTSSLPGGSFDLVHARSMLSTAGWAGTQLAEYQRLLRPGGVVVIEEPDTTSFEPPRGTTAMAELLALEREAWLRRGNELDAGRHLPDLFADAGLVAHVRAEAVTLAAGHEYHLLPIVLAHQHRADLTALIDGHDLDSLIAAALADRRQHPGWATTFTLIQAWATQRGAG